MNTASSTIAVMRRSVLQASLTGLGLAGVTLAARPGFAASDDTQVEDGALVERLIGRRATESALVRLLMPAVFSNGYSVPLTLTVDSPMTENDHVKLVHILAPKNPIIVAATFAFAPQSGRVAVSTRIRLAEPQTVLALAELNDGALLMARTQVKVDTNGCA
jgi:sulfur-oxidizing protein SoxY